jgi:hypothetical protein
MKYARSLCVIALLILAFTLSVSADTCGDVSCPGIAPPPPVLTVNGETPCGATQIALSVIQSVLSLS